MKIYFSILLVGLILLGFSSFTKTKTLEYYPKEGFVPDAKTAVKIAEVILNSIYGEKTINAEKPLVAKLNKDSTIWTVSGSLPKNSLGGVATIQIQKSDCKIIFLEHGK